MRVLNLAVTIDPVAPCVVGDDLVIAVTAIDRLIIAVCRVDVVVARAEHDLINIASSLPIDGVLPGCDLRPRTGSEIRDKVRGDVECGLVVQVKWVTVVG